MSEKAVAGKIKGGRRKSTDTKRSKVGFKVKKKSTNCQYEEIKLIFIAWDKSGAEFLKGANFCFTPENLRVHVFYSKGTPAEDLPKFTTWLIGHESLTDSKDAVWIDLTAFAVGINAIIEGYKACQKCLSKLKVNMAIVWGDSDKGLELKAILNANNIDVKVTDGRKPGLIEMFPHVCLYCKLIFKDSEQASTHDKSKHNYLCHNSQCERSKRGNGFYTRDELESHMRAQKFCKLCPNDVFCTEAKFDRHVKDNHKYCPCTCHEYYEGEENLLEQFYALYPLPCLEEPACKARFKDIDTQAFHHKSLHGSEYPYFCLACYKSKKLVYFKTARELLKHARTENHVGKDFQFAIIPRKELKVSCK